MANPVIETFGPVITIPENVGTIRKISSTNLGEHLIVHNARVSSKFQDKDDIKGLLSFCLREGHVSVFEQADMTVEIICPLFVAIQILRHWSFRFQQFSQRYQDIEILGDFAYVPPCLRSQDTKNRQNSLPWQGSKQLEAELIEDLLDTYDHIQRTYRKFLDNGVAKELARTILPEGVTTKLYMKGNIRSWMSYLKVRSEKGVVQHEHVLLAESIFHGIFKKEFPIIASMMDV
ncbi:MAG: FAD-dependent thymidylate synthase [Nitrososphaeraceae archaeon]|nr:FAD-dependent thymidylate synthase [Nitrososphaeraceae archaeon]